MFRTIYGKIATVLLGLFFVIGLLYILLTLFTTKLYIQEGGQRLHRNLAKYLVSKKFFIQEGKVNKNALKESFEILMNINPNVELYLLDPSGNILAYSAPSGRVKRKQISIEPLNRFLNETDSLPIAGDDPRDPNRQKVFSVSPIPLKGSIEGYLYIILGGEAYDSVVHMLQKSYILRLSAWVGMGSLLFVFMAGLFLFQLITRRLQSLSAVMETFKQSDFQEQLTLPHHFDTHSGDEIDRLGIIFTQMSNRIIKQVNKIRQADSLRRELVSNVSHDLRTPLTSLQGYLETLLLKGKEMAPQEQRRYLTSAIKHSERLKKLVSELFELAKLDSEETQINAEPFHLGELVQNILQKFQLIAEKKKIRLQAKFPEDLPFVYADIGLIERAIQNLIDNALRYTQEGGNVDTVLIPEETKIAVQIVDNGYGISNEDIPYIFSRFYRVKEHDQEDFDSAGLGLAITKRIIELHGSSIEVLSELNTGTTFTFHLPVYRTES